MMGTSERDAIATDMDPKQASTSWRFMRECVRVCVCACGRREGGVGRRGEERKREEKDSRTQLTRTERETRRGGKHRWLYAMNMYLEMHVHVISL